MNSRCQGLTLCNERCKKTVIYGNFCSYHIHPEEPDNTQIAIYNPDVEWPEIRPCKGGIRYYVRKFK